MYVFSIKKQVIGLHFDEAFVIIESIVGKSSELEGYHV